MTHEATEQRHHGKSLHGAEALPMRDPVCGMMVPADAPLRTTFEGQTYVFCSARCLERFQKDPRVYLPKTPSVPPAAPTAHEGPAVAPAKPEWTCPMHP